MNMEPTEVSRLTSLMPYVLAMPGLSRSQQTTALHSGEMDARGVCLLLSSSLRSSGSSVSIPCTKRRCVQIAGCKFPRFRRPTSGHL